MLASIVSPSSSSSSEAKRRPSAHAPREQVESASSPTRNGMCGDKMVTGRAHSEGGRVKECQMMRYEATRTIALDESTDQRTNCKSLVSSHSSPAAAADIRAPNSRRQMSIAARGHRATNLRMPLPQERRPDFKNTTRSSPRRWFGRCRRVFQFLLHGFRFCFRFRPLHESFGSPHAL